MAENRTSPRYELEVEVGLHSETNFYTGLTQDISTGGLFVATHQIREVGDHVRVKFSLPGSRIPIEADSEVRWVRESSSLQRADGAHGMGLRLVNVSPEAQAAIESFLAQRESLFYDDGNSRANITLPPGQGPVAAPASANAVAAKPRRAPPWALAALAGLVVLGGAFVGWRALHRRAPVAATDAAPALPAPPTPTLAAAPAPALAASPAPAARTPPQPMAVAAPASPPHAPTKAVQTIVDLGYSALDAGKIPRALEHFRRAVKQDPKYGRAWFGLAATFHKMGKPEQAVKTLRLFIALGASAQDLATANAQIANLEQQPSH